MAAIPYTLYQLPAVEPDEARGVTFSDQRYDLECKISRPPLARFGTRYPETWPSMARINSSESITPSSLRVDEKHHQCARSSSSSQVSNRLVAKCVACLRRLQRCVMKLWSWKGRSTKTRNPLISHSNTNTDVIELSYKKFSPQYDDTTAKLQF